MTYDVVDLIIADHRRFRELFTQLNDEREERSRLLLELSALLVAHAEAEETDVYPTLRRLSGVDADEVDHGSEEHVEGHQALLDVLELPRPGAEGWDEKLRVLHDTVTHHLDEEEDTILTEARDSLSKDRLNELGDAFNRARRERLDNDCGRVDYVRALVKRRSG